MAQGGVGASQPSCLDGLPYEVISGPRDLWYPFSFVGSVTLRLLLLAQKTQSSWLAAHRTLPQQLLFTVVLERAVAPLLMARDQTRGFKVCRAPSVSSGLHQWVCLAGGDCPAGV